MTIICVYPHSTRQQSSAPMQYPFFVYGTLRPGEANYGRYLAGRTTAEEPASLPGAALYSPGPYPFLVVAADLARLDEQVYGEVIDVEPRSYAAVLHTLDDLEGYAPNVRNNLYERILMSVHLASGVRRQAWIYLAGERAIGLIRAGRMRRVPAGNWNSSLVAR
jgi:gamma-glutamylcyclotransferase (GGCT)/AIG2-like uncharacterized protein YtfP